MATIDNLKMSTEAMQTAISNFEARKSGLEIAYLKISNEVRTLDGTWHGEASEKFKSQFDGLYKKLQQNETVMSNVINNLKSALSTYEAQESEITSMMNSAEEGTAYPGHL